MLAALRATPLNARLAMALFLAAITYTHTIYTQVKSPTTHCLIVIKISLAQAPKNSSQWRCCTLPAHFSNLESFATAKPPYNKASEQFSG